MFCGVVMSVKTAAPAASSVRKNRARLAPVLLPLPTPTYIRVFLPGRLASANPPPSAVLRRPADEGAAQQRPGGPVLTVDTAGDERMAGGAARAGTAGHRRNAAHRAGDAGQQIAVLVEREARDRALEEHVAALDERPRPAA